MAKVTDPALIAALEAKAAEKVTDPALIAALEAKAAGPARMDPSAGLPRDTVSALGPNLDINRESTDAPWWTQVDQQDWKNRLPFAAAQSQFFSLGGDQVPPMDAPEGRGQKFVDTLGAGIGVGADFAVGSPVAALATPARVVGAVGKGLLRARVPAAVAQKVAPSVARGPLLFGGHTQLSGGSPAEVAMSAGEGALFGGLQAIPGLRQIMANPVGHEAVNVEALALLNMAHGMPFGEAQAAAVPTALGLKLGGMAAGPQPGFTPERTGSWDAVREMRFRREVALRELQAQEIAAEQARVAEREASTARIGDIAGIQPEGPRDVLRDQFGRPVDPPQAPREGTIDAPVIIGAPNESAPAPARGREPAPIPEGPNRLVDQRGWPSAGVEKEAPKKAPQEIVIDGVRYQPVLDPAQRAEAIKPEPERTAPEAVSNAGAEIETARPDWANTNGLVDQRGWPLAGEGYEAPRRTAAQAGQPRRVIESPYQPTEVVTPYSPARGRQPLPTRRGDVTAGSILGGGGEAFKFKELRQALGDLGRRMGDADARIADKIAPLYRQGMTDSEFLGQREVRDQMMRAENIGDVLEAAKAIASGQSQPPSGPTGAPTRQPAPTSSGGGSVAALKAAQQQPRRGSRLSEAVNPFLNSGETYRDMTQRLKDVEPIVSPARLKEIRTELRAERGAAKAAAKEAGEEAPKYPRNVKEEAEVIALRENLDPEFVKYVEAEAAKKADGGKSPLDVGYLRSQRHSQEYLYQGMGGGKAGDANPLDGPLIRNVQDSRSVGYKWHDATLGEADAILKRNRIKMDSPESYATTKLIEGAKGGSISDFAQTPEGAAILSGVKGRDAAIRAAEEVISMHENTRVDRNSLTDVYGETPLAKKEGHAPKYEARPAWWDIKEKTKRAYAGPEQGQTVAPSLDSPDAAKKSDPHARRRMGDDTGRDWDIVRGLHRYIGEEAAVISGTMGLHNNYQYARFLELNGFHSGAKVVRAYSQSDFNKRGWGLGGQLDRAVNEGGLTNVAGNVMKWNYDRLADSVFTLNLGWNMVVQPSSAVFVYAAGGDKAAAQGILGARSPEFRKFVDENVFARKVKSRRGGSVGDIGQDASAEGSIDTGLTKLKHKAQTVNQVIEREIDMYAAYVGMKQGEAMGLKGRELTDFMSDSIKKTQDVYNRQDRPELVRSKMFNVLLPFSGFGFNMASNIQEQGTIPFASRVGTYQNRSSGRARVAYTLRLGLGAAAANALAGMIAGREELYGPSSLPMYDILTGSGFGKGRVGPAIVIQNDIRAWQDARDGKYGEAVARELKQRVPAARVLANIIQAEAYANGGGKFFLPESQMVQAVVLGVWATPAGRAYIDKMKGKGGSEDAPAAPKYPVVAPAGPVGGAFPTVGRGGVPIPARR